MAATLPPEGTPALAMPGAHAAETPRVLAKLGAHQNRLFFALIGAFALIGLALGTIMMLLPLKSVTPVLIEREAGTGALRTYKVSSDAYSPEDADLKYFIGRYVVWTYTIHRRTTEDDFALARQWFTRGKGVNQLDGFFERERPLARLKSDAGLTRRVEISSVSLFKDAAVVKFTAVEQGSGEKEEKRTPMTASLQFFLQQPKDDEKLILTNPVGLYITDLNFEKDIQ
jgi:type IV secretion system protein TrbF